ncbi:DUF5698 domain-containing protein [Oceanirhabdus sp. W0125-5]|uniref:DUF5698 domain-containing protein n=1 Tax=Oceanirhabdus sp. W0125-5 TaxID=2999116 RepID=UPI0022F2CE01|nr:DUF5698 domain-containing protein [Oceanirhabdus sp. W0125-5]WBW96523.1 DUF5698 domain-containing protein [Oceanirhabdus sp. W0125-5]
MTLIFELATLFLITAFTNVLGTLKTLLISKKIMNPVYFVVFVDAMIFATIVSKVTSSTGIHYTLAFALGKSMGVFIGGKVDDKLALGIIEIDLFLSNKDKMIAVAESLRSVGYTVNNYPVRGNHGDRRYKIEIVIKKKEFKIFENILEKHDIYDPTMKIKNVSKIHGKITPTNIVPTQKSLLKRKRRLSA